MLNEEAWQGIWPHLTKSKIIVCTLVTMVNNQREDTNLIADANKSHLKSANNFIYIFCPDVII